MARTEEGARLTQQHRRRQIAIRAAILASVLRLWSAVDPTDLSRTIGPFATAAALLIRTGNRQSATLASRYFVAFRGAEEVPGTATVVTPEPPPADLVAGLIRGAGLSGIIRGRQRGFSPQAAAANGFTRVAGTTSNLVLDGGRQVITEATLSDPRSTGKWQRVASAGACAWCAMQASRGPVFSTREFRKHAGCNCDAEPVYEGSQLPATSRVFQEQWEQAQRDVLPDVHGTENDALNAFRRLREDRA